MLKKDLKMSYVQCTAFQTIVSYGVVFHFQETIEW